MYGAPALWDERSKGEEANLEWLCETETLRPLFKPFLTKPRCAALVVGSGTSSLPEVLYDGGIKDVTVVDFSPVATEGLRTRAITGGGGRAGLTVVQQDICDGLRLPLPGSSNSTSSGGAKAKAGPGAAEGITLQPTVGFAKSVYDLVIDRGTIDCILTDRDGRNRAETALRNIYEAMKTPGTLLLVSHSPPADRLELIEGVYWHDIKVKVSRSTPFDKLTRVVYRQVLEDLAEAPSTMFDPDVSYIYVLTK